LGAFRRAFGDTEPGADAPAPPEHNHKHWKAVTLLAIDEHTEIGGLCPNGHVVSWVVDRGKPDESWVYLIARYPRELLLMSYADRDPNFKPTAICVVCGEEGERAESSEASNEG
jgi:hypothetical protein